MLTGKYDENTFFPPGDIRHGWPVTYISYQARAARKLKTVLNGDIDSLVKLALKFVLNNQQVGTVILGCKNEEQVLENLSVSENGTFSDELVEDLNRLYRKRFNV